MVVTNSFNITLYFFVICLMQWQYGYAVKLRGHGFESESFHCRNTTCSMFFTHRPLSANSIHSNLQWLDVPQWILHKLGVTVHRCLQGRAPQYLVNCCHPTSNVASRQRLRSSSRHHLVVPRHRRSTLGRRAFSVAGPMAWNALPDNLGDPLLSADNFRKTLKTHLFRNALGHLAH